MFSPVSVLSINLESELVDISCLTTEGCLSEEKQKKCKYMHNLSISEHSDNIWHGEIQNKTQISYTVMGESNLTHF